MKKVSIIYWSNGGNVELIANCIAEGASVNNDEVTIKHVMDAELDDVLNADAIAFGSPAMVDDDIEKYEMRPFIESLRNLNLRNKPVVLFGSCGWRDDKFIHNWEQSMEDLCFNVIGKIVTKESLNEEEVKKARELGKLMVK